MSNTIYLVPSTWDLTADSIGNIAMAQPPYALAQDAASAIKLFLGELWYDTSQGVPYLTQILGHSVAISVIKSFLNAAAMTVPGVTAAQCFISSIGSRQISGQVQVTDTSGVVSAASF